MKVLLALALAGLAAADKPPSDSYGAPPQDTYAPDTYGSYSDEKKGFGPLKPSSEYGAPPKAILASSYGPPPKAIVASYGPPPDYKGTKAVKAVPAYVVPVAYQPYQPYQPDYGKYKGKGKHYSLFTKKGGKTYFKDSIRDKFLHWHYAKDYFKSGLNSWKNKLLEWKGRVLRAKGYYLAEKGEDLIQKSRHKAGYYGYGHKSKAPAYGKGKGPRPFHTVVVTSSPVAATEATPDSGKRPGAGGFAFVGFGPGGLVGSAGVYPAMKPGMRPPYVGSSGVYPTKKPGMRPPYVGTSGVYPAKKPGMHPDFKPIIFPGKEPGSHNVHNSSKPQPPSDLIHGGGFDSAKPTVDLCVPRSNASNVNTSRTEADNCTPDTIHTTTVDITDTTSPEEMTESPESDEDLDTTEAPEFDIRTNSRNPKLSPLPLETTLATAGVEETSIQWPSWGVTLPNGNSTEAYIPAESDLVTRDPTLTPPVQTGGAALLTPKVPEIE